MLMRSLTFNVGMYARQNGSFGDRHQLLSGVDF